MFFDLHINFACIMTHDIYVLENIANGMLMNSDYNTGYKCSDLQLFVYGK